jgi:DNA-binding response OmpR family regulator
MLTARDSDVDKVALLEAGADDYVVKPFSPPEFVARVRAVLRRTADATLVAGSANAEGGIVLGGLAISPAERSVAVDGVEVTLTAREFDLLLAMARVPGVVLSREQLLEHTTGEAGFADARGVDVHVRHLREKLGDAAAEPRFVETVRGVGYRVRKDAG